LWKQLLNLGEELVDMEGFLEHRFSRCGELMIDVLARRHHKQGWRRLPSCTQVSKIGHGITWRLAQVEEHERRRIVGLLDPLDPSRFSRGCGDAIASYRERLREHVTDVWSLINDQDERLFPLVPRLIISPRKSVIATECM
jgi:hypothetical protein